jgi:hypothetical protein
LKIINQITVSELWKETKQRVEQDPHWAEHKGIWIMNSAKKSNELLVNHRFDIVAETAFGGVKASIHRLLRRRVLYISKGPTLSYRHIKTLNCKKEDYLAMALLSNLISYHMGEYVMNI